MKAIVVTPFSGLPDGEMVVRNFAEGDEVRGDLARVAVEEGWAEPVDDGEAEPVRPPPKSGKRSKKAEGEEN